MPLSGEEFEIVLGRFESLDVNHDSLAKDLLDHIACSIEERIENGQSFSIACEAAFEVFNRKHVKRIEYETQQLITDQMKRHTKILGILGITVMVLGGILKLQQLQGASVLLAIGFLVIGFGFFGSNTIDTIKNIDSIKGRIIQILGAFGALLTLGGGFFKIMHLPGATILLGIGPALLLLYFSFSAFLKTKSPE